MTYKIPTRILRPIGTMAIERWKHLLLWSGQGAQPRSALVPDPDEGLG